MFELDAEATEKGSQAHGMPEQYWNLGENVILCCRQDASTRIIAKS